MIDRKVILWFRNDLRLQDNEALNEACDAGATVYPIYVFDDRVFKGKTKYGFRKTDVYRAKFILESVLDLKNQLQGRGTDLIIKIGKPEEVIFDLAKELKSSWVFCNRERTDEELKVQDALEKNLWSIGQEVRYSRGKMLYYTADLPFPITHTPDVFTQFRKEVEKIVPVRPPLEAPQSAQFITEYDYGIAPTLEDLGYSAADIDRSQQTLLMGGCQTGLERLKHYFWDTESVTDYKETRNGLLGLDYSSKFSAYLAHGCLSPKMIYHELEQYEKQVKKNSSTYHLFFELLWRDFFRLMGKKHGNTIFQKGGIKQEERCELTDNVALFKIWSEGRTGIPFIDAAMRELNTTGFMSNRARQNVASFLVNDLHVNWQMGAEYFESLLIDYDPCSNWGNWNYVSGVGCDPRENRYFNIILQAKRYDAQGNFVKHWIPELKNLPSEFIHQPHLMSPAEQAEYGVILAKDYPNPCIKLEEV